MQTFVRCASLNGYVELARSLGLQPGPMMRRVGLDPADLATPEKWISAAAVGRLLSNSARDARERGFPFPIVKDAGGALARRLGARMTPQAVLLDSRQRHGLAVGNFQR